MRGGSGHGTGCTLITSSSSCFLPALLQISLLAFALPLLPWLLGVRTGRNIHVVVDVDVDVDVAVDVDVDGDGDVDVNVDVDVDVPRCSCRKKERKTWLVILIFLKPPSG